MMSTKKPVEINLKQRGRVDTLAFIRNRMGMRVRMSLRLHVVI